MSALLVVAGAAGVLAPACAHDPSGLPDIVLVTIDTLRADRLGCYGYFRDTSPELDRLAGEAHVFDNAYTHMSTTLPSHVSMMTSTHPLRNGVRGNFDVFEVPVREAGVRMLAQMLGDLGYTTAGFVGAAPLKRITGIAAGFDTWDEPDGPERRAAETTDRVLEWLSARPRRPFFLWVHYYDPHEDYSPPPPYDTMFRTNQAELRYLEENDYTFWTHPAIQQQSRLYDGEVRYVDTEFGRLRAGLEELGAFDDAAVVVAADHGEGLGQHDWISHDRLHNELIRVPLLLRLPGMGPGREQRHTGLVGLVDLVPTLVEELGLPIPDDVRAQFEGHSMLGSASREWVFAERTYGREDKVGAGDQYTLLGQRWKYFLSTQAEDELFDLSADPRESHDVLDANPDTAAVLRERIEELVRGAASPEPGEHPALPPDHVEQLRALGYVD